MDNKNFLIKISVSSKVGDGVKIEATFALVAPAVLENDYIRNCAIGSIIVILAHGGEDDTVVLDHANRIINKAIRVGIQNYEQNYDRKNHAYFKELMDLTDVMVSRLDSEFNWRVDVTNPAFLDKSKMKQF